MSDQTSEQTNASKAEPSGPKGDNPATAGTGTDPQVTSSTPENAEGALKPSSPGETGITPGTDWK